MAVPIYVVDAFAATGFESGRDNPVIARYRDVNANLRT